MQQTTHAYPYCNDRTYHSIMGAMHAAVAVDWANSRGQRRHPHSNNTPKSQRGRLMYAVCPCTLLIESILTQTHTHTDRDIVAPHYGSHMAFTDTHTDTQPALIDGSVSCQTAVTSNGLQVHTYAHHLYRHHLNVVAHFARQPFFVYRALRARLSGFGSR